MVKKTYKVSGMDCTACATMIELDLEDAGIKAKCNYATETLEVETKNSREEKKVKEIVQSGGYQIISGPLSPA